MNTRERLNHQAQVQEWVLEQRQTHPVALVLLVALGSFAVGLLPLAYTSAVNKTQTPTTIVAGEAGIWSVLGEKIDGN